MSTDHENNEDLQSVLAPVLRILSSLKGHFVFSDSTGEQFVLVSKQQFDAAQKDRSSIQRQLPLGPTSESQDLEDTLEDVLDATVDILNREIALSTEPVSEEGSMDDLSLEMEGEPELVEEKNVRREYEQPAVPPVRVKFEPIRGDLPPELQE